MADMITPYDGDAEFKRNVLAKAEEHEKQDRFIHGIYTSGENDSEFKGCSLGCTAHSIVQASNVGVSNSAAHTPRLSDQIYNFVSTSLKLPIELTKFAEFIFESTRKAGIYSVARRAEGYSLSWTRRFLESLPADKSFDLVQVNREAFLRGIDKLSALGEDIDCDFVKTLADKISKGRHLTVSISEFIGGSRSPLSERDIIMAFGDAFIETMENLE